ncbi:MAG: YebC/PmpR family DNA-binding transcriptional regulator, partial [Oscillospiraceae bacterium]|nr:YebC/PmpR family DNA-binding transcriptional regulator [Oscillospiraceae bacterium]
YEGYAPGGVAVIVEIVTDNRNRTASDVRHIFDKCGGSLGTTNSVGYMFDRKGMLVIERKPDMTEDDMMLAAMDAGADDIESSDDTFEITTDPTDFSAVRTELEKRNMPFLSAELTRVPQNWIAVDNPETVDSVRKLIDMLEDMDDVMNVYHNAELPEEPDEED